MPSVNPVSSGCTSGDLPCECRSRYSSPYLFSPHTDQAAGPSPWDRSRKIPGSGVPSDVPESQATPAAPRTGLEFIDTGFENASPVWYETAPDGATRVYLMYDHERNSPNRAAGHFHFRLHAKPGSVLTLEFKNLDNVYNGRPGSVADELKAAVVSSDGREWRPVPLERLPGDRVRLTVTMPGPELYVARVEPYRLSDLEKWLASIRPNPKVRITPIGKTAEGRPLEVVRVGRPEAPYRVFLRARAHAWEPGGNWIIEGLVNRLLKDDTEANKDLTMYCVYVMPMANKDGVARGRTRFNSRGKDLNREWDRPADPVLSPENHALESWLEGMIRQRQAPHLALELHNDGNGLLHISRPPMAGVNRYLDRMKTLEALLRKHTWFTGGARRSRSVTPAPSARAGSSASASTPSSMSSTSTGSPD